MLLPLRKFGSAGISTGDDCAEADLPPNAFTEADGGAFRDKQAKKTYGYTSVIQDFPEDVYWFQGWETETEVHIAFCATDDIYTTTDGQYVAEAILNNQAGAVIANLTTTSTDWQSEVFGTFCILNNGTDIPMYSLSKAAGPPVVWTFKQIPGWGTGPTGGVSSIRAAFNHLIALGVDAFPYTIFTSVVGSPEAMPTSWDYATPGTTAKRFPLQSSGGPIIDGGMLSGRFIVYQRYKCSTLSYVGGNYVFQSTPLFDIGLINKGAFLQFENWHLVVGEKEIVIHDGSSIKRPDDNRVRVRFYGELVSKASVRCSPCDKNHEVLIHYDGNRILIYNYLEDTWTFETIGNEVKRIARAVGPAAVLSWSDLTMSWADATFSWASMDVVDRNTKLYQLRARSLDLRNVGFTHVGGSADYALEAGTSRLSGDSGILVEGSSGSSDRLIWDDGETVEFDAYLERNYIDLDELTGDAAHVKRVDGAYLQIKGQGLCDVQFGISDTVRDTVRWGEKRTIDFDSESDREKIDVRLAGRYLHWRIGSWDAALNTGYWQISGMDLDVDMESLR